MSETPGWLGRSVPRKEDRRLVTGGAAYLADLRIPGTVDMAILRSPLAHASIRSIDVSRARALDGVLAVVTGRDLVGSVAPFTKVAISSPPIVEQRSQMMLGPFETAVVAVDKVVRAGEPIAVVVALDRYLAEDAVELIEFELDPLPVVVDPEAALEPDAAVLHPQMTSNLHASFRIDVGDVHAALESAPHVLRERFVFGRSVGSPIENRGVLSSFDSARGSITHWSTTQRSHWLRGYISSMLSVPESDVRVIAPEMGGSFGSGLYPEDIIAAHLTMRLRRPVRWLEDRRENLLNARHARDQIHYVEVGFDDDGRILALKDHLIQDCGAHNPYGVTISYNTAVNLRGQFHIPAFLADVKCVLTNKTPNTPVRGAGRPEAVFVIDRIVDMIARKVGLDPTAVRFANLVPAEDMPYDSGMLYRDGVQMVYDSGDYPAQLRRALGVIDYDGWRKRQADRSPGEPRVGIGISAHLEGSGIGPFEGAMVRVDHTGRLVVHSGSNPHGQGHETTLAQVCADVFGVTPDDVSVSAGDTALIPYGGGTNASRSAVTAGSAVHVASGIVLEKVRDVAGAVLEISPDGLVVDGGVVHPRGAETHFMTLAEVAAAVTPEGVLVRSGTFEAGLEAVEYFHPPTVTFASGTHVAVVAVDEETGGVRILDYAVVDDCGRAMNPTIVDGQQHGGVAHGIGQTLYEEAVYNEDGQMVAGTLMDYLLPSPTEVPNMTVVHENHPTPLNPLGVKGIGEGGTTSAPGAIINAIADALGTDDQLTRVPVRPADIVMR